MFPCATASCAMYEVISFPDVPDLTHTYTIYRSPGDVAKAVDVIYCKEPDTYVIAQQFPIYPPETEAIVLAVGVHPVVSLSKEGLVIKFAPLQIVPAPCVTIQRNPSEKIVIALYPPASVNVSSPLIFSAPCVSIA